MPERVGVAWYSRDTWTKLRTVAPDPEGLEGSYEEWVAMWHAAVAKIRMSGVNPERVEVEFDAFSKWCAHLGRALDSAARAAFVAEELRLRDGKSRSGGV